MSKENDSIVLNLEAGERGSFFGAFWTIIIIAVCILVTVALGARTDFVRAWLEDTLADRYGSEISIGKSAIVFPYVLVLSDVASVGESPSDPGFLAAEVRIPLHRIGRQRSIEVNRATLRFRRAADQSWAPTAFSRVAGIRDEKDISGATAPVRDEWAIRLTNCDMIWENAEGVAERTAESVQFLMEPHEMGGQKVHFYKLEVAKTTNRGAMDKQSILYYWISTDANPFTELTFDVTAPEAEEVEKADDA